MRRRPSTKFPATPTLRGEIRKVTQETEEMEENPKDVGPQRLKEDALANAAGRAAKVRTENSPLDLASHWCPRHSISSTEEETGLLQGGA